MNENFGPKPSLHQFKDSNLREDISEKVKSQTEKLNSWEKELMLLLKLRKLNRTGSEMSTDSRRQTGLLCEVKELFNEFDGFENTLLINSDNPTVCIREFRSLNRRMREFERRLISEKMKILDRLVEHYPVNFY